MASPCFLLIELASEHPDQVGLLARTAEVVRGAGGELLAAAHAGRVACLEPGTIGASLLLARWPAAGESVMAAAQSIVDRLRAAVPGHSDPLVLRVEGLPAEGLPDLPDIPTVASVPRAPRRPRNALLVIRGTAFDPARMDAYRDVILPMMKERGSYYEVFALQPGAVTPLSGQWREQIFAISRWPTRAAAEDFWYSERYQTVAIPKRIGAGRFTVHMLDAAD